jgi:hypothetical protein
MRERPDPSRGCCRQTTRATNPGRRRGALLLGRGGAGHECVPRELVDGAVALAPTMRHENRNVVAGGTDVAVEQERGAVRLDEAAHRRQELRGRSDVTADRADVGFDDAEREFMATLRGRRAPRAPG